MTQKRGLAGTPSYRGGAEPTSKSYTVLPGTVHLPTFPSRSLARIKSGELTDLDQLRHTPSPFPLLMGMGSGSWKLRAPEPQNGIRILFKKWRHQWGRLALAYVATDILIFFLRCIIVTVLRFRKTFLILFLTSAKA